MHDLCTSDGRRSQRIQKSSEGQRKSKSSATNIAIFTMASPVLVRDGSDVSVATAKDHWAKCGGIP